MNSEPRIIRASYAETEEFFIEAVKKDPRRARAWLWGGGIYCVMGVLLSIITLLDSRKNRLWWLPLLFGFVLFLFGFGSVSPAGQRWLLKRSLRKRLTDPPTQVWFEFGDAGFLSTGKGGSTAHLPWALVPRVIERTDGVLIYNENHAYHWLPKRAFASERDFASLLDLIAAKVSHFERIRK